MYAFSETGNTVNAAVTATSAALALTEVRPSGLNGSTILVTNVGSLVIFIKRGDSTVTAALATSVPILPNTAQTFNKGSATHMAHISTATGNTVYVTTGEGV